MMRRITLGLIIIFFALLPGILAAQSTITFHVDMSPQMKDSTFIPSQHSIEIMGNQLPFSKTRSIRMVKQATSDSVYVAKVSFPSIVNGRELAFTYYIKNAHQKLEDQTPRSLILGTKDRVLPVVRFNEFLR